MDSIQSKSLLDPYKTIGCFAHGPVAVSKTSPFSVAVGCYNSFKIYSDELAIKMVSPCFSGPVRAIYIYNEFTYVLVGTDLLKIKYHHIVKKWSIASPLSAGKSKLKQNVSMMVFDGVIIVSIGQSIYMLPELKIDDSEAEQNINSMNLGIHILQIVHPVTYINKILAYSQDSIILVNPISEKILFKYTSFTNELVGENKKIMKVCPSPLIDIVAICLSSGEIVIFNIRTSKTVFTMKQKRAVSAIAFSESDSLMASADQTGNIILWDLQNKKIVYRLESAFPQAADFLSFVPGFPLIVAVSSKSNSIRQFRINLDDIKTLLQFRERSGCSSLNPITGFKCHNNKQITFDTKNATIFSSLYSHSNMYSLPSCLDSCLPYHLVSKNYNIELFRQRTVIGKLSIHENAELSRFTITKKFVIVGTKTRVIKVAIPGGSNPSTLLHVASEWKINDPSQIILHNEHYIYILCFDAIHIVDFNEPNLVGTINQGDACYNLVSNQSQSMLALENRTKQTIQIWDMRSIRLCRQFPKTRNKSNCSKICFTADNRYLLSAQVDCSVSVWSILQNNLYKNIKLQAKIVDMSFTPDNGYFMSVFEGAKEINIWNNYIGKITTSQDETEVYKFETTLNYFTSDYREKLINNKQINFEGQTQLTNQDFDSLLDTIPDAHDPQTNQYDFRQVSKWMPLVYYDEIRSRNSINKDEEVPALPFFLNFKNLSEEQAKLNNQLKQESREKKNKEKEKIDSQLSNDLHEIRLNENSTVQNYTSTWDILSKLSIAEADYQLRRYLIRPGNLQNLIKMFTAILKENISHNQVLLNVLLIRTLQITGTQICQEEIKQSCANLHQKIRQIIGIEQDVVERCAAVSSQAV